MKLIREMRSQMHRNRLLSTAACLVLLSVLLLSTSYIAMESHHDCVGDHCPVCHCLQHCQQAIRQMGTGLAAVAAVLVTAAIAPVVRLFFAVLLLLRMPALQTVRLDC